MAGAERAARAAIRSQLLSAAAFFTGLSSGGEADHGLRTVKGHAQGCGVRRTLARDPRFRLRHRLTSVARRYFN